MPSAGSTTTERSALTVSVVLHPFLVGPLTVLLLTDVRSSAVIAFAIAVPLLVLTVRNVRRGVWTNHDVSVRAQRGGLYWPAIALTAIAAAVLHVSGAEADLVRGVASVAVMFVVAMVVNRWLKISLHMLVGAFAAVLIGERYGFWLPLPLLALLAWSRITLKRHSWTEVVAGVALGAATGIYLITS